MSTVADVLHAKEKAGRGIAVLTIGPDDSVLDAARRMNERKIGSLVVTDDGTPRGDVLGIITERDILTRVVAAERPPASTAVGRVMTSPVISCAERTTLDELRTVMREKHIRHVPVVSGNDPGSLKGMISIGDLNTAETEVLEETIRYLETYMYRG